MTAPSQLAGSTGLGAQGIPRYTNRLWMVATVGLGISVAFLSYALFSGEPQRSGRTLSDPSDVSRMVIDLPVDAPLTVGMRVPLIGFESPPVAMSPDGSQLVYVGQAEEGTRLYHRALNSFAEPRPVPGTEGALYACFSPDGTEVGFLTSDRLKKVSLAGGLPTTLSAAVTPTRASWIVDTIFFVEDQGSTLSRVSEAGGEPTRIVTLETGNFSQVLPNGRAALVTSGSRESFSMDYAEIQLLTIDDLTLSPLVSSAYDARYLASGHLLYARASSLLVVPFDLDRLAVTGDEVVVVRDAATESIFGNVHAAASANGTLAYVAGGDLAVGKLAWVNRRGDSGILAAPEQGYGVLDVSPDGQRIAVQVMDVRDYVWIWDNVSEQGRVVATPGTVPHWDFTGDRVAYLSATPWSGAARLIVQDVYVVKPKWANEPVLQERLFAG